ncbi:MAG: bifunctional UDP-N-acetylglucosamine diphosphorylase/glucosamine-1-phosphate N-acetyltransferase GlmU [Hydrogenibacillus schlegelii]|uniref:Bifunctional protein GlmU n=1 Tax=Hydrogenibacillus schlegelii TaxID=1484 RepID=A0A947D3A4_HYDSH|nr:bifunctional UDP-N-acetylglucosamine diphosphorylase/glucosamine-1-phosphate N-acetyltransferase GlmU [Hydrogenibacillus schlegelii]
MKRVAVVLAAGKGTRMRSERPKVLHPLLGKPMLGYVLEALGAVRWDGVFVVVGHRREWVEAAFAGSASFVVQDPPLGTGDAVKIALKQAGAPPETLVVLNGDAPLLRAETIRRLVEAHEAASAAATVAAARLDDPTGYGRLVRDDDGRLVGIVEEKDATPAVRAIREVNAGLYAFFGPALAEALSALRPDNAQQEYYLTDAVGHLLARGAAVEVFPLSDPTEARGVNDRRELAEAEAILRRRIIERHLLAGVTVEDPASTWIGPDVEIAADAIIRAGSRLMGRTRVGEGADVGPYADLTDTEVGAGARVRYTVAEGAAIGAGSDVGPYAHLRPGTRLGRTVRVGNFVEVKNSTVGDGTKLPHLTYIGDATVGSGVNVGCGTITVNYDGVAKHRTVIEDGAFIGCNTNLIAPVRVGAGAYVAAGSTITDDVPDGALAIARARQANKPGYAERLRAKFRDRSGRSAGEAVSHHGGEGNEG